MNKIIIICGPTGVGKTSAAIQIAKKFNGEIISADSIQVYKYLDIGTAKPEPEEMSIVPHHLISCMYPKDEFDAGHYVRAADQAITDIVSRGKIPIVAGGTGLYIKALLNGLFRSESVCIQTLSHLTDELKEHGALALHKRLAQIDPESAQKIHPHDSFRVIRALEIFQTTGNKISDRQKDHNFLHQRYNGLKIGLYLDRDVLYRRINHRVDAMMKKGLLNEVISLIEKGYTFDLKPMQSIGYKHMAMYIQNQIPLSEAITLLKRDSRRYAKRQFTWFNKDKSIIWRKPSEMEEIENLVKDFLT